MAVEDILRTTGAIRMVSASTRILHEIRMRDSVRSGSPEYKLISEAIDRIHAANVDLIANTDIMATPCR